jgi:hypothetical protein
VPAFARASVLTEAEHRHHLMTIERMVRDGYSEREIAVAVGGERSRREDFGMFLAVSARIGAILRR